MARVALCGFKIAMIEFELVGCAGMSERVKYHIGKAGFFLKMAEIFHKHPVFAGPAIGKRDHQIVIRILVAQKGFQFFL
ncbi:hypothetical protein SDC9_111053 [bioreactor metagenome]|uniref:Uncharacterized protein n=1 Tax=bioreactor metagenome TaxID=1076179 RepID=A0A645BFP9_9ZZZZ